MTQPRAEPLRNRRRYQRLPFSDPVLVVSASEIQTLPAGDIAAGGIFLQAPRAPRPGAQLRVEFRIDGGELFSVLATMVREELGQVPGRAKGFALRFDAEDAVKERIERALLGGR